MEETSDLLKKVRKIEIKTKGLSRNIFAGEYHSAFKGRGMAFSEVREYNYGDDIRNIDWNVTARYNSPFVNIFEEERELTVMILIDVSASNDFGTNFQFKKELITEISAVLSFSAMQNNDKIGVIMFSNKIEKFIPPQKGKKHILRIIRELLEFKPENRETNVSEALRYLTNALNKRATAYIISDFFDLKNETKPAFEEALKIAKNKHDLVALSIVDQREKELPPIGLVRMKDAESGEEMWLDSSDRQIRKQYKTWYEDVQNNINEMFSKSGIDYTALATGEDYVKPLVALFKKRG